MFKSIFSSGWFCSRPYLPLVAVSVLMAPSPSVLAEDAVYTVGSSSTFPSLPTLTADFLTQVPNQLHFGFDMGDLDLGIHSSQPDANIAKYVGKDKPLTEVLDAAPIQTPQLEPSDPLESPHPIPWNWVMTTHAQVSANGGSGVRYYRSPSLVSPDGQYAAYSRIEMEVQPELYRSRVRSVMFLENLKTRELRVITASSPIAEHQFAKNSEASAPGSIAILIPVSWSSRGDRLLARQFEGLFSTSDASDYAVIWDRDLNRTSTVAPGDVQYSSAVLLGWSQTNPDQVLFRAGELGEEKQPLWAVNLKGQTVAAALDQPLVIGKLVKYLWAGPQVHW